MHRASAPLNEGDVEFAMSLFDERPFFFIDDAPDMMRSIKGVNKFLSSTSRPACIVLGGRTNEWRQCTNRIRAYEYAINPLSQEEILRLLKCLESNGELGQLAGLSESLRIAAVQRKHDRQLLVALREVTEGAAGFDAIIEDEYTALRTELSRALYAAVSCAYQLKTPIRDVVLARALRVDISDLYANTADAIDGIITYETVDEARGVHAARCRHHVIAEIVWSRCLTNLEREHTLLSVLDALNLQYGVDAKLFDALIRSDTQVNFLNGLEAKTKFFELACQKDPENPFVRQHYGRMLLREKRLELALEQIESGLRLLPDYHILLHTKGTILRDMAIQTPSLEIARKRMAQSEHVLRKAISDCLARSL